MDCGGMTPLWLHRTKMKGALAVSAAKEKRRHGANRGVMDSRGNSM
jgi:hypothetical protein